MKRIYISSLNRVHDPNEEGDLGKLYLVDWDTGRVIPHSVESDAIQIGRSRGIRGLCWFAEGLLVAGVTNTLTHYDPDNFSIRKTWKDQRVKYLHQIRRSPAGQLHMASTGNDRLVTGWNTEDLSINKDIIDPYITDDSFPKWGGDRLHFNSLAWDESGDEYHIYNSPRMIFNYMKGEVFAQGGPFNSLHDIVINPKEIIVNSSGDRTTLSIDRKTKEISVLHKSRSRPSEEYNLHGMTRGLAQWDDHLFIGITPGTLLCFRLKRNEWEYESHLVISNDRRESIFDILLDPRDWKNEASPS